MSEVVDRSGKVIKPRQPIFDLLERGADPNCISSYPTHPKGLTPLMFAANKGSAVQVLDLLKKKANINANDENGYTALDYAIAGDPKIESTHLLAVIKILVDKGIDFKSRYSVARAVKMNFIDAVKLFIEKGVDPNSFSKSGKTLLFIAASKGYEKLVRLLLKNAANPKVANKDESEAHGNVSNAVQKVADVLAPIDFLMPVPQAPLQPNQIVWRKPEEIAWAKGHHEIVKILQQHASRYRRPDASSSSSPSSRQDIELDTLHTPLLQNPDEAGAS